MAFVAFVIALLLLAGMVDVADGWLIALTVVSGLAAVRFVDSDGVPVRLRLDVRLAAFALAALLLAGVIDPTKDWLIALSVVTGVAAFMPRIVAFDRRRRWPDSRSYTNWDWNWDDEFWTRGQAWRREV